MEATYKFPFALPDILPSTKRKKRNLFKEKHLSMPFVHLQDHPSQSLLRIEDTSSIFNRKKRSILDSYLEAPQMFTKNFNGEETPM